MYFISQIKKASEISYLDNDQQLIASKIPKHSEYFKNKNEYLRGKIEKIRYISPVKTLERDDLEYLKFNYRITNKLDGERVLILINHVSDVIMFTKKEEKLIGTSTERNAIYEGELYNGMLYIYDVHYKKNKKVYEHNLDLFEEFKSEIKQKVKPFYDNYSDIEENKINLNTDGYIFQPRNRMMSIFKWKFNPSIDIEIRNSNRLTQFLSKQGIVRLPKELEYLGVRKILGTRRFYKNKNKTISEFEYINKKWKLLRVRKDKKVANSYLTIISVLKSIHENITFDEIKMIKKENNNTFQEKDKYSYILPNKKYGKEWRKKNNKVKRDLYSKYKNINVYCDLSFGRGGDLNKIKDFENCLLIDNSRISLYGEKYKDGFNGAIERIKNTKMYIKKENYFEHINNGQRLYIVHGDANKDIRICAYDKLHQNILNEFFKSFSKFDLISSFFALHYYDKQLNEILGYLKKDGKMIGSYMESPLTLYENGILIYNSVRVLNKVKVYNVVWDNVIEENYIDYTKIKNITIKKYDNGMRTFEI